MVEVQFIEAVIRTFFPLLAIMDPFISTPTFLALTRNETAEKKHSIAFQAVFIAAIVLFVFLFFGQQLLSILSITLSSMQIAGAIVLLILGLELVLGLSFPREKATIKNVPPAALVIGTPLITGPGVITTTILFVSQYGLIVTAVSSIFALLVTWLVLRYSHMLNKLIGANGTEILSRIMGLLLIAVAAQFAVAGIKGSFGV